mgnify:CR=1 FL=1
MKHVKTLNTNTLKGHNEEGRMRRVPDFLPVSLQDILYSRKPELRER